MNNQLTPIPSKILQNKLAREVLRLQSNVSTTGQNPDFSTLEDVLSEATKILSKFYKNLSEPGFNPIKIDFDTLPNADVFNQNITGIQDDLIVIFREFENLESIVLGNFNYMVSRLNRLNRKLKSVSSNLGDFILFSNLSTKDAIFFADSFNNLSRVEVNSPLLNFDQCEINQVEGIVTLPIDRNAQVPITTTQQPVINSNSNGRVGNNEQLNAQFHGNISDILDNNADTWFEYERVLIEDDGVDLLLDFTINLNESKIINFIKINPNNFGTRTQVEILAIDTSTDGNTFLSIKDDIPIAGFIAEDEENVFTLAPSTSKFAGQGFYTFTPRKAKYIHFTLKQTTPYIITTTEGIEKFRYAIGIRDINAEALPYKSEGELISTEYQINDEVRKVVLLSSQKPDSSTVSNLVSIDHFISPDNGITWHQIRSKNSDGLANIQQDIPELLDFNGVLENSIITSNSIKTLRYKALMKRNTDSFEENASELADVISSNTELHSLPVTTPFEFKLQNKPIEETLKLIDPQFGSRGKENVKYKISIGNGGKKIILLPFKPLVRDFKKTEVSPGVFILEDLDPQSIFIDGKKWERTLTNSSGSNDEHYLLNFEEGRLEFGNNIIGKAVPNNAVISMNLSEERLFPGRGTDHIAKLDYPTSNDKKQIEINIIYPQKSITSILKKGSKRHQLKPDIIQSSLVINPNPGIEVSFIDGFSEFNSGPGFDFSVDYQNGVLYLRQQTDSSNDTTVIYRYNPRTIISESEWNFMNSNGISDSISISDSAFRTFSNTMDIPEGVKYFNLANLAIVRGTVLFTGKTITSKSLISDIFKSEVEFIDGRSELLGVIQATEQLSPILGVTNGEIRAIPFKMKISSDISFSVIFTNQDIFKIEKFNLIDVLAIGDYYIDRSSGSTGFIYIKLEDNVQNPGEVNYYYKDPQVNLIGRYSINYKTGEVYLYNNTIIDLQVTYEYTDIRIKYDIARLISNDDWDFNSVDSKIIIKDREILNNIRTPQTLGEQSSSASKYYQASYQYVVSTRESVSELEPFFTPTLKDYAIRIVTQSRLI